MCVYACVEKGGLCVVRGHYRSLSNSHPNAQIHIIAHLRMALHLRFYGVLQFHCSRVWAMANMPSTFTYTVTESP